jgi:hypothetical protein
MGGPPTPSHMETTIAEGAGSRFTAGMQQAGPFETPIGQPTGVAKETNPRLDSIRFDNRGHATSIPRCTCPGGPLWQVSAALHIPQYGGALRAKPLEQLSILERALLEEVLAMVLAGIGDHTRLHVEDTGPGSIALQWRHPMTEEEAIPMERIRAIRRTGLVLP